MKKILSLSCAALMLFFASCSKKENESASNNSAVEKNKMALEKVYEAFNSGNTDSLGNYVAENCVEHTPMPGTNPQGLQGLKDMIAMQRAAYPDLKCTIISIIGEGEMVSIHFNMKGTNTGAMGNMPATGKAIDINGVDLVRFENGKGVEHWGYMEEGKMMQQLGMGENTMPADSTMKKDVAK
jgi:steroid delta-isomerase-like uncharacterized protein